MGHSDTVHRLFPISSGDIRQENGSKEKTNSFIPSHDHDTYLAASPHDNKVTFSNTIPIIWRMIKCCKQLIIINCLLVNSVNDNAFIAKLWQDCDIYYVSSTDGFCQRVRKMRSNGRGADDWTDVWESIYWWNDSFITEYEYGCVFFVWDVTQMAVLRHPCLCQGSRRLKT